MLIKILTAARDLRYNVGRIVGGDIMRFQPVRSAEELVRRVEELGILPFFRSGIDGYSVEELTPPQFWFVRDVDGPWEWRQQAIDHFAYGKFLRGKAGFISREWFPMLCNARRGGLDFEERYEEGRVPEGAKRLFQHIRERPRSTLELRSLVPGPNSAVDRAATFLMMSTDIVITGFDRSVSAQGRPYGWGINRYQAADEAFPGLTREAYSLDPEDSLEKMRAHILSLNPGADEKAVSRLLRA